MKRFTCIVGGRRRSREAAALDHAGFGDAALTEAPPPSRWPFERHILPPAPGVAPRVLLADLHHAFPGGQTPGTRLVLTQSSYQLQRWIDWLAASPDARVASHASRTALARTAPEAFAGRGPWGQIEIVDLGDDDDPGELSGADVSVLELQEAFRSGTAAARLDTCLRAAANQPDNPAAHLAVGSAHMERQQLPEAQQALDRAVALAPDWEAPWFEYGKLWLRGDDLARAAERFAEAARLMPSFAAALSNLGAALAEIERTDAAVDALRQALRYDPRGFPILNNLAVILREQGRLDEAIEAGRQVIALAPDFVFGYYNLGHALFLSGRFADAREAYSEGHARDPQKNAVQASRLAVVRAACGDTDRAADELQALARALPDEVRPDVLGEAQATLEALLAGPRAGDEGLLKVLEAVTGGMRQ